MTGSNRAARTNGLSQGEVTKRRQAAGWNEIPSAQQAHPIRVFLRQFTGFLVLILIAAAAIALFLGEVIDAIAIGLIILLNGVLGFVQEWRAETALKALSAMMAPTAMVVRDGKEQRVPARDLVPGDTVLLAAGNLVPADITLVISAQLAVDESALTGESLPISKAPDAKEGAVVFAGTSVVEGRAEGIVTETGLATEFGKIAELTGKVRDGKTRLQVHLERLAGQLGGGAIAVAAIVIGIGLWAGRALADLFMTGLSLAVAIVPEGLPAVVTITLALGATAMARQRALVRRLQAIETLGAASVICADKTGTLTENKMTATTIWTPHQTYQVTGTGYDPTGHIETEGRRVRVSDDTVLDAALATAATCTHASLAQSKTGWEMHGTPTEGALVTLAYKGWAPLPDPHALIREAAFTSDRKRMSVIAGDPLALHCKGAPESVLDCCDRVAATSGAEALADAARTAILDAYRDLASQGMRVIALASRPAKAPDDDAERGLIFSALVGLIDPPRPEVKEAVRAAKNAGIRIIMITGDSPVTAAAIARQLELPADRSISGADLDTMPEAALQDALRGDVLFARTRPAHKIKLVQVLQAAGQIVAMTGDGVNDAPALKQADIGISMGQRGTEVARQASDLVLLDDNFATIVLAIREGRRQFDNVRKFVRYLLSSNAGEIVAIVANILIGGPLIFLATQILWMNLVTDGVTAVALGLEKAEPGQMRRPPRAPGDQIVGARGLAVVGLFAAYTGTASLWIFYQTLPMGVDIARTTAFTAMVVFEKVSVFAFRSLRQPCTRLGWLSNPILIVAVTVTLAVQAVAVYWAPAQTFLHTVPLAAEHWLTIASLAVPLIILPEILKLILGKVPRSQPRNRTRDQA